MYFIYNICMCFPNNSTRTTLRPASVETAVPAPQAILVAHFKRTEGHPQDGKLRSLQIWAVKISGKPVFGGLVFRFVQFLFLNSLAIWQFGCSGSEM